MRGPKTAYELITPDKDTLYFLTDENNKTELFLGESLISNSGSLESLSEEAQEYLKKITEAINSETNPLNDGEFLVYDTATESWIPATVNVFEGATAEANGKEGLVPAPTSGQEGNYLRGDGTWANLQNEILPQIISEILGDERDNINSSYDTIKEISDWILTNPANAAELNERIINLEEAIGLSYSREKVQAVDEEGNSLFDEEGNPIYEQEPVYETDANGNVQKDENGNPVQKIELKPVLDENGDPVLDENGDPEMEEVPVTKDKEILVKEDKTNDVEIIKAVIGHLDANDSIYPKIVNKEIGTLTDRLSNLETNFTAVTKTVINSSNESKLVLKDVGDLSELLIKKDDNTTPTDIVDAINTLDARMQWKELKVEQQGNNP